jgi:hypothetical protein
VARLSVRLTFQSVIEEIVCEELDWARYQRRPVMTDLMSCRWPTVMAGRSRGRSRPRSGRSRCSGSSCATRTRRCAIDRVPLS